MRLSSRGGQTPDGRTEHQASALTLKADRVGTPDDKLAAICLVTKEPRPSPGRGLGAATGTAANVAAFTGRRPEMSSAATIVVLLLVFAVPGSNAVTSTQKFDFKTQ